MKVQTWLPVFSGFYNTIWEPDTTREIDYINEQRAAKGFTPIDYNDCEWDNGGYEQRMAEAVTRYIGRDLVTRGFIKSFEFEKIVSPREYNFKNDSIDVIFNLIKSNKAALSKYIADNYDMFAAYLKETYTSRSGFISHYPNNPLEFMQGKPLEDSHKLGAILNFILLNEAKKDSIDYEYCMYEDVTGNNEGIQCSNYENLIEGIEPENDTL